MQQVIFLDRDGVINYNSADYIKSPDEWQPIPGSLEAIAQLSKAGFTIFIITNQSGVGRGLYNLATLHAIHDKMLTAIKATRGIIKQIYYCPHKPEDNCHCRKPKPGLLLQAATEHSIDLSQSIMIGDSFKDIAAGRAVNAKTVLVMTGNGTETAIKHKTELADTVLAENLNNAVAYLLNYS